MGKMVNFMCVFQFKKNSSGGSNEGRPWVSATLSESRCERQPHHVRKHPEPTGESLHYRGASSPRPAALVTFHKWDFNSFLFYVTISQRACVSRPTSLPDSERGHLT